MPDFNSPVLATDLDGTLIPLPGEPSNEQDLRTLAALIDQHTVRLVYVTGRRFASVQEGVLQYGLPNPEAVICDVGTTVCLRNEHGDLQPSAAYRDHLRDIVAAMPNQDLRELLTPVEGLRLQEEVHQSEYKLSFYADASQLDDLAEKVQRLLDEHNAPYSLVHSVDPFKGSGMVDLLPKGVSKAYALRWWVDESGADHDRVVFAGDTGNDLAALTAGYQAIVVGNATPQLKRRVYDAHLDAEWDNRLRLARGNATTGVLEGCRWFELLPPEQPDIDRLGATPISVRQTYFNVWAPARQSVAVRKHSGESASDFPLARDPGGYFTGVAPVAAGEDYSFLLDGDLARPDPTSRWQPHGVHGPSRVVDPLAFPWTDDDWSGVAKRDLSIYELHPGAFTELGTLHAAIERLPELVDLGVTAVELLPVAQSPGDFNWGYDGVNLFAVRNTYGGPDALRAFVDACHAHGLAVLLDVVYNHVGPEGNYLSDFGPYASRKHHTPWGDALNFDGRRRLPVRRFVVENAIAWLDEFHLDGLRLDAAHFMHDESDTHILQEIRQATNAYQVAAGRQIHLVAEANVYDPALLAADNGALPYDAIWCDCLMFSLYAHALPQVRLTGRDYRGAPDIAEALAHGYLYFNANHERATDSHRADFHSEGDRSHLRSLVLALQTHDSVGNHPHGWRLHQLASKEFQRAAAALVLLYPAIPLIFMGEETASEAPFPFFTDFQDKKMRRAVNKGRAREYPSDQYARAPQPTRVSTFELAKLHRVEQQDQGMRAWYQALLWLRKEGLNAGWLSPEQLTTEWDQDRELFLLHYAKPIGGRVTVAVRLAKGDSVGGLQTEGVVRLCSHNRLSGTPREVDLYANHAVVIESD